jgi:CRISPR-associated protein Csd2
MKGYDRFWMNLGEIEVGSVRNVDWREMIPESIRDQYEYHNINNAVEIMCMSFSQEWRDICDALAAFSITTRDIVAPGGNESRIPKRFAELLRPRGWRETRISGDLLVRIQRSKPLEKEERMIERYLDGYKIDYVKNNIAIDMEWNSKDQTYDRDLVAFRNFYETGLINAAAIITRSTQLNDVFKELGVLSKYGASTTQMGKLLPRVTARRQGGCPLFIVGITQKQIIDFPRKGE